MIKIENGHVLHLIALPNNIPVETQNQQNNSNLNNASSSNISGMNMPNQEIEFLNGIFRSISILKKYLAILLKFKMKAPTKEGI